MPTAVGTSWMNGPSFARMPTDKLVGFPKLLGRLSKPLLEVHARFLWEQIVMGWHKFPSVKGLTRDNLCSFSPQIVTNGSIESAPFPLFTCVPSSPLISPPSLPCPGPVVGVVLGMLGSFSLGYIIDDAMTEITLTVIVCFSAFMISEATEVCTTHWVWCCWVRLDSVGFGFGWDGLVALCSAGLP